MQTSPVGYTEMVIHVCQLRCPLPEEEHFLCGCLLPIRLHLYSSRLPLLVFKTTSITLLLTIWMPHLTRKPHRRGRQRIILWELQFCREYASFKRCAFWSLYQCFPDEEVVFADRAGVDSVGWVVGEVFVFLEEPFRCYRCGHCGCCGRREMRWGVVGEVVGDGAVCLKL